MRLLLPGAQTLDMAVSQLLQPQGGARETVRQNFLMSRLLEDWSEFIGADGPPHRQRGERAGFERAAGKLLA